MIRRVALALRAFLHPTEFLAPPAPSTESLNALQHQLNMVLGRQIEFHREIRTLIGQATLPPVDLWRGKPDIPAGLAEGVIFTESELCRQESFDTPYYRYWAEQVGHAARYHRKIWEFIFICQVLYERNLLVPGSRGLGFGVGEEPLAAVFAARGCRITGTDMGADEAAQAGWTSTQQHAAGKEALRKPWLCDQAVFDANVEFRTCDMNAVPDDLQGYDFCWSACALEHLGSLEHGLAFIERSLDCLKPGGFAIHTTEFNLSSNDDTMSQGSTVLYRRRDLEAFQARITAKGHFMAPLNLDPGHGEIDRYIDVPPYLDEPHLKLMLSGFAATSVGIIIQKAF